MENEIKMIKFGNVMERKHGIEWNFLQQMCGSHKIRKEK